MQQRSHEEDDGDGARDTSLQFDAVVGQAPQPVQICPQQRQCKETNKGKNELSKGVHAFHSSIEDPLQVLNFNQFSLFPLAVLLGHESLA